MQRKKRIGKKLDRAFVGIEAERLKQLLSTLSTLRSDGRALIDQIRGSLTEMRELRRELHQQRGRGNRTDPLGENRAAYLEGRYKLTAREAEVAMLLAQGRTNETIAQTLRISSHTARHHTQRILTKLNVHSRAEAGAKIRG
jgi:DNA-binding NarL/FixJ family response regulator